MSISVSTVPQLRTTGVVFEGGGESLCAVMDDLMFLRYSLCFQILFQSFPDETKIYRKRNVYDFITFPLSFQDLYVLWVPSFLLNKEHVPLIFRMFLRSRVYMKMSNVLVA